MIHIPDNTTDTSPFCLPVQPNRSDAFKLALYLISRGLEGVDDRIVHTLHDEILIEAIDGIEDQVQAIVKVSMERHSRRSSQRSRLWRRSELLRLGDEIQ